jgi:hypothetical protein
LPSGSSSRWSRRLLLPKQDGEFFSETGRRSRWPRPPL